MRKKGPHRTSILPSLHRNDHQFQSTPSTFVVDLVGPLRILRSVDSVQSPVHQPNPNTLLPSSSLRVLQRHGCRVYRDAPTCSMQTVNHPRYPRLDVCRIAFRRGECPNTWICHVVPDHGGPRNMSTKGSCRKILSLSFKPHLTRSFQADRDPRERGSRPLNSDR